MATTRLLVDTVPLVALLRADDMHHKACVAVADQVARPGLTCWPVLTEAAYILRNEPAALEKLLRWCDGTDFELLPLTRTDLPEISSILSGYADQNLQLADAALLHLANRHGIDTIFTLDHRDFSILRLANGQTLNILPN